MTGMSGRKLANDLQEWVKARSRHHLSHAHVQMARELGMNPRKRGKVDNHREESWKAPLPLFIERLYAKRFGRERPQVVMSVQQWACTQGAKRAASKAAKRRARMESVWPERRDEGKTPRCVEKDSLEHEVEVTLPLRCSTKDSATS
jgi:hypothetical protein